MQYLCEIAAGVDAGYCADRLTGSEERSEKREQEKREMRGEN